MRCVGATKHKCVVHSFSDCLCVTGYVCHLCAQCVLFLRLVTVFTTVAGK